MEGADKLLWSVQVDHQLFALEKLDVTVSICVNRSGREGVKTKTQHGFVCVNLGRAEGAWLSCRTAGIISGWHKQWFWLCQSILHSRQSVSLQEVELCLPVWPSEPSSLLWTFPSPSCSCVSLQRWMVLQTASTPICLQALWMHNLYDRKQMVSKKMKSDVLFS